LTAALSTATLNQLKAQRLQIQAIVDGLVAAQEAANTKAGLANASLSKSQTRARLLAAGVDTATIDTITTALSSLNSAIANEKTTTAANLATLQADLDTNVNKADAALAVLVAKTTQFVTLGAEAVKKNVTVEETAKAASTSDALKQIADVTASLAAPG